MELRDYIDIWREQARVFWIVVCISVLGAAIWQINQPVSFQATLLLNIGRAGAQGTGQYTYDSFYRLQADERFADTVVRWLGSPRVVEDILAAVGVSTKNMSTRELRNSFEAKRLSSQMIEVTYSNRDAAVLGKISQATLAVLNQYTSNLNTETKEPDWFVVVGSEPVIRDIRVTLLPALTVGVILGIFIGFWGALVRHYLKGGEREK